MEVTNHYYNYYFNLRLLIHYLLQENFNIDDVANVEVIKDLFEQLNLANTFHLYEGESYNMIYNHIQQLSEDSTQDLLFKFLQKLPMRKL